MDLMDLIQIQTLRDDLQTGLLPHDITMIAAALGAMEHWNVSYLLVNYHCCYCDVPCSSVQCIVGPPGACEGTHRWATDRAE